MKNQRGVTLIALVVTIIVLIILAGVAIAALMGQNGLITRARESKKLQIEGQVRDEVTLAISAAKVVAENQSTRSKAFSASKNLGETDAEKAVIKKEILADLGTPASEGAFSSKGYKLTITGGGTDSATVKIEYQTNAYKQACNNAEAKITVTITVNKNNFVIPVEEGTGKWEYGEYVA